MADSGQTVTKVEAIVLGSAQDGGLPHAGCRCVYCERARSEIGFGRLPAALGLADGSVRILIDATSAYTEQLHLLRTFRDEDAPPIGERYFPPDAIVITHAHTGHYTGLWQLDRSVMAARGTPILAPPATAEFLRHHEPWITMMDEGFLVIEDLDWGTPRQLSPGIRIEGISVPHRSEWPTDTACLRISGPRRSLLYLPDIDSWGGWEYEICDVLESVDVAILDGSFWDVPTSPNVPHPPVLETLERLGDVARHNSSEILFTHLNHTNPAVDPGGDEAALLQSRGFQVAREGMRFEL